MENTVIVDLLEPCEAVGIAEAYERLHGIGLDENCDGLCEFVHYEPEGVAWGTNRKGLAILKLEPEETNFDQRHVVLDRKFHTTDLFISDGKCNNEGKIPIIVSCDHKMDLSRTMYLEEPENNRPKIEQFFTFENPERPGNMPLDVSLVSTLVDAISPTGRSWLTFMTNSHTVIQGENGVGIVMSLMRDNSVPFIEIPVVETAEA